MPSSYPSHLDSVPAALPPPGVKSNLIDPESRGPTIVILDAVFFPLMALAVVIRVFVRAKLLKTWGWEDVACLLAALGSLSHLIQYHLMIKIGLGRHLWDIPASWLLSAENAQLLSSNGVTYPATIFFAKLSILLFYVRIFSVSKSLRRLIYASTAVMALFYSAMVGVAIASILRCIGVEAISLPLCKAYSGPIILLNGSFNVLSDFWILALPFPYIRKLKLYSAQKIRVMAVFALGIVVCAASLARLVEFIHYYRNPDVLWSQGLNAAFTIFEMNVAIIISCASTFPPLYVEAKRQLQATTSTIRNRLLSSSKTSLTGEKTRSSMDSGSSVAQRKQSRSTDRVNPIPVELNGVRSPGKPRLFAESENPV